MIKFKFPPLDDGGLFSTKHKKNIHLNNLRLKKAEIEETSN